MTKDIEENGSRDTGQDADRLARQRGNQMPRTQFQWGIPTEYQDKDVKWDETPHHFVPSNTIGSRSCQVCDLANDSWVHRAKSAPAQTVSLGNPAAARPAAEGTRRQVVDDPNQPWWWRKIVGPALDRVNDALPPHLQTNDLTRGPTIDWCRFRRESHCYFPKDLDERGTQEAGYAVWIPTDRGVCPRTTHQAQRECEVSEAGPDSGERMFAPDATYSWAEGGQRRDRRYS